MRMTLDKNCVFQNFPEAKGLKEGESVRTMVRSSTSPTGEVLVNIKRLTEEYFSVCQLK